MSKKKKIIAVFSILISVSMLASGTFAWTQMVTKTNEFIGSSSGNIILHDDFDPATGLKDVYVESLGPKKTLFVRIKLGEYMNLNSSDKPSDLEDPEMYPSYYKPHFHAGMISPEDCGQANDEGDKFHDSFKWTVGGQKFYYPAVAPDASLLDQDPEADVFCDTTYYDGSETYVRQTPDANLISIDSYNSLSDAEKKALTAWIMDKDGFAYWSQPLGEESEGTSITPETGLLLHHVETLDSAKDKDFYYAINIKCEAVDHSDLLMWTDDGDSIDPILGVKQGVPSVDGSGRRFTLATDEAIQALNSIISLAP
ncbi:MAG: hypothetical protein LBU32_05745 [Clostridiales bacterium]|jgi:hypothetical protein|nr:hypothetical protein [Clostridiales bacterium]